MSKKENVFIFPFDAEFLPILKHKNLIENYNLVGIVSLNQSNDKKSMHSYGFEFSDIMILTDPSKMYDYCDTIFFTEAVNYMDIKNDVIPVINAAIKNKKNIVYLGMLDNELQSEILETCNQQKICFTQYKHNKVFADNKYRYQDAIEDINTPIILVAGIAEKTHKFEIQLTLRDNLKRIGYNIGQVGSRHYCELFGFHSFPHFMYSNVLSECEKVIMFNRYIKEIENTQHPDIIIIGIPGGVMPFNNQFTNRFGILAFEVSQAILPDACILSILYEDYKVGFYNDLYTSIKYKLGIEIDCFNLANVKIDWNHSRSLKKLSYITIGSDIIDHKKNLSDLKTPVFNMLNAEDSNKMTNHLVKCLSDEQLYEII